MPKRLYESKKEEIKTQRTGTYFNAKNSNKKFYEDYTKENLITEIKQLKKRKQYGLVWEEQKEKFDKDTISKLPVLEEIKNKEIKKDKNEPVNLLIEGDNYHSLSVLNYTHEKAIDVIYIDPPYNTGNKDFKYNDRWVDREDAYRHSKWLSFMNKRLRLAKNLLKRDGLIFISIGEDEVAQLKMMCDEIFGEKNFVSIFTRKIKGAGKSTEGVALNNDYLLFFSENKAKLSLNQKKHNDKGYKHKDKHFKQRGFFKLSQCLDYNTLQYNKSMDYEINIDDVKYYAGGRKKVWRERQKGKHKNIDWVWRWGKKLFEFGYKNNFIVIKKYKHKPDRIYTKTYQNVQIVKDKNKGYQIIKQDRTKAITSLEFVDNIYSNDNAKKELDKIFNEKVFDYPKPTALINKILEISSSRESIVLDFFAGSGTTGHAVLKLNSVDGGNRQFILCTNNENEIAKDVCYPRVKKVIEGYKDLKGKSVKGLGGSLKYFKTAFVDATPSDANKKKLTAQSTEMLCIRENTFEKVLERKHFKVFKNSQKHIGILYDQVAISDFKKVVKNIKSPIHTYIFSLEDEDFSSEFEDMNGRIVVSPIPEVILRVYRRIFGIKI